MDDLELTPDITPDLDRIERLLLSQQQPAPSPGLSYRVLSDTWAELRGKRKIRRWPGPAACAALLLVAVGLLAVVLQATVLGTRDVQPNPSVDQVAGRLQSLSPGLSREESVRQAKLRYITGGVMGSQPLRDIVTEQKRHDP